MLDAIITWSLRHRLVVVAAWLTISVAGVIAYARLPIDAFPDTTPVQVQVNTVAPALSPLEIERQITARVEQGISGLPDLVEVRSLSRFGMSQVTVVFEDGTDIYKARQVVSERIRTVELPAGVDPPTLGPVATGLGEVFHYLVTGDGVSAADLRTTQDWVIKPQLASVSGVAEVNSWGGEERQLQVVVDPVELQARGLTLADLADALGRNNLNVGGGTIDVAGEASLVQGIALLTDKKQVEQVVITARNGVPVRVSDVARVVDGHEIRRGAVTADGTGEVVLGLGFMLMGENSHDVTRRLEARLTEVRKSLPEGIDVTPVYERTTLVDQVLATVRTNLLEGAILVIAVLFIFLGSVRAGLIVAAAIPLSMLFAFDLMVRAGVTGSLMSLGAIDFGLIVDSSVISVENTVRRLSEDRTDRSKLDIVRDAALEVRRPTMFGELIILIVYLPILFLEGMEGKLFRPMALTVVFALAGSMLLSLTLVPVLSSLILPRRMSERENPAVRAAKWLYRPVLRFALRWRWAVLAFALLLMVNGVLLARQLGSEFVPRLNEGTIVINTVRLASVSLDESVRYGTQIERVLLDEFPDEIERIWTRTGSAEVATDPMGIELSDVFVMLTPRDRWKRADTQAELVAKMQEVLGVLPGMRMVFTQPIEMRVNEMNAGIRGDVGVKLFGDDLEMLRTKAAEIEAVLKALPGAADVVTEQVTGLSVLQVEVNWDAIARRGIPAREVLDVVEALGGIEVGEIQPGERRFPLAIRLHEKYRRDEASVRKILVTASNGDRFPLDQLAHISTVEAPAAVNREWGKRRIVVQANVRGRDVGSFVADARRELDRKVELPPGYYLRFGGQFEHLEAAKTRLMIVVPIALALILLLLYFTYGRVRDTIRVFTGVPFAAIGGIAALWLRDMPFSISAGVGFVALSGVAVLGDMVLVSTIRQLLDEGKPVGDAVRIAAERRLRPVLMTALVASLGFVPMALNTGIGAEVQRPLATVVIGGVISSTLLTLVVLPALYTTFAPRRRLGEL
ncbi:MAG: CusA/CzcA family heavy metal efflux RND transporter [Deltaproteobacteria bacterium]|nr:CusA/CzcA family heavy metal efflux RND transporter [Kofleriaceae bacterium]